MSSASPFVKTRQRNRTFSPPVTDLSVSVCTEGFFHFSVFDACAQQKEVMDVMGGEMICTGALKGHMMSTREEKPKLNLQSKCSSASS